MQELLKVHLTHEEHAEYSPLADELVLYAARLFQESPKVAALNTLQLKTMVEFGLAFDVADKDYWRAL